MTQDEVATRLLEAAAKRGWQGHWAEDESDADLLFGHSLSFLKALVGTGHCCHICGAANYDSHLPVCSAMGLSYANRTNWVATRLVVLPDEKRITWLHDYIFKETP